MKIIEKYTLYTLNYVHALHHAYVYEFNKIALVVGDDGGRIINTTLVTYDSATLESYGKVLEKLKAEILDWAYDTSMDSSDILIPEKIVKICEDMSEVNCKEALYSTVKLWKVMFENSVRRRLRYIFYNFSVENELHFILL